MIEIDSYNALWPKIFAYEKKRLLEEIQPWVFSLEHVGSTAVPGLAAKATIDMCMVVKDLNIASQHIIKKLEGLGYKYLPELEKDIPDRRYLQLLDNKEVHLFHMHIVEENSKRHLDYLLMRDYLREHKEEARQYERLKHELAANYRQDRVAYTEGKAGYITSLLRKAKASKGHNC